MASGQWPPRKIAPPPVRVRVRVSLGLGAIFLGGNCPRTIINRPRRRHKLKYTKYSMP